MIWLILFWASAGALLYSYALYPFLLGRITARRLPHSAAPDRWPSVSILLSAYNEEKNIAARLDNLLQLDYPASVEILVGTDGCTDATNDLVRARPDSRLTLHAFPQRRGKPAVLRDLAGMARSEVLVFTDAAAVFAPEALRKLVSHFADPNIGGVGGEIIFYHPGEETTDENVYWRMETFLRRRESLFDSCLGATGAIYAIRRELWPDIPANTLVDDFVVPMRVREQRRRFIYEQEAVATMKLPPAVGDEMVRRIRIGAGGFQAMALCWRSLLPWRGLYTWSFWSHKVLRWLGPFFMLGALIANFFLLPAPFYVVTMMLQLLFYLLALAAVVMPRKLVLFSRPHYFVVINLALLLGFFRYVTGTQRAAWQRTAR